MSDRAIRDLSSQLKNRVQKDWTYRCPPDNSVRDAFQILPSRTLTSRPSVRSCPSGGCSLAKLPGNSSPKMIPKSLQVSQAEQVCNEHIVSHPLTFSHVLSRASRLYRSSSTIVSWIIDLSLMTVAIIFFRACSFFSTLLDQSNVQKHQREIHLSIMFMTFVLIFRPMPFC